jgi:hypothetical protein
LLREGENKKKVTNNKGVKRQGSRKTKNFGTKKHQKSSHKIQWPFSALLKTIPNRTLKYRKSDS